MSDGTGPVQGSCLCGSVKFEVEPRFTIYRYCFCSLCRKNRGCRHVANILVKPNDFRWTAGEQTVCRFDLPNSHFGNCFCKTCGTPVPRLTLSGKAVIIPAGSFDADPAVQPDHVVFWDSRVSWIPTVDDIPKYAEFA